MEEAQTRASSRGLGNLGGYGEGMLHPDHGVVVCDHDPVSPLSKPSAKTAVVATVTTATASPAVPTQTS